ncbi:MAG: DinB family protein [Saprospiraceae bacterium]
MYFNTIPEITNEITKVIAQSKTDFLHLEHHQLNWKPNPESWSVGQCLDHLVQSADAYEPLFKELINKNQRANFWRNIPFLPSLFGKTILKAVGPFREKKSKTFSVFEPTQSNVSTNILNKLEERLLIFSGLANQLTGFPLEKTIVTSPVAKLVNYSLLDALNIVTVHNYRHFNQAKEVMAMQEFPKEKVA